jgi:hypothetical protein
MGFAWDDSDAVLVVRIRFDGSETRQQSVDLRVDLLGVDTLRRPR